MNSTDESYLSRCLELAKKGSGWVAPNPLVGSVIVYQDRIIGEGFHKKYGGPHAEVNAINSVQDKSLLPHSTLYVNLEPCTHHGKTPPCADLIIKHKIKKVVIGCVDSFSEVSGKGITRMRNHGIEVIVGILEQESRQLNKRFFTFHEKKRPYIILKWAQSEDGFIEPERKNRKGSIRVTSRRANTISHHWRHEEAAILIGKNTLITDDPQLNTRNVKGTDPIPIVLSNAKIKDNYQVFKRNGIWIGKSSDQEGMNSDAHDLDQVMSALVKKNIQSILVEGGPSILESFLKSELYDELRIWKSNQIFENGLAAPSIPSGIEFKPTYYEKEKLFVCENDHFVL